MLKRLRKHRAGPAGVTVAIVASTYNGKFVDAMLKAAQHELKKAGAKVRVVRVPGAFEIPAVASALAAGAADAIICLGVVFQGQTSHAQHVTWGVTHALAQLQVQRQVPVIHAVFQFDKEEHARVRCLGKTHNRGTEAARTALEMARVMKGLD